MYKLALLFFFSQKQAHQSGWCQMHNEVLINGCESLAKDGEYL